LGPGRGVGMSEAEPPPSPLVEGVPVPAADHASLLLSGHTGALNRTKRLKFIASQGACAKGHEGVEEATCRLLVSELKAAALDVASYRWATSTAAAARIGGAGALDQAWVVATEKAVKAAESACSAAPLPIARFRAEHGDPDGALQSLRKVKERQTDAAVALETLPIIFGADLSKATTRSFAKETCTRLLKPPLLEQLEPSARAQVQACDALLALTNRDYSGAAHKFAAINSLDFGADGFPGVVLPREIGVYGTVCALAALDRTELQSQLLHSASFLPFIDANPSVIGMATDFHAGNYAEVLQQVEALQSTMYYDVHMAPHREALTTKIRTHCFTNYIRPFGLLDLNRMAEAFQMDIAALEAEVASLVIDKKVEGRIDSAQKQLVATVASRRLGTYQKAMDEGELSLADSKQQILRANLASKQFLSRPKRDQEGAAAPGGAGILGALAEMGGQESAAEDMEQRELAQALAASQYDQ